MKLSFVVICLSVASTSMAAEPTYWQDVRPLLRKHCTVCHREAKLNDKDISAGLALDTLPAILKNPAVLKPGQPDASLLFTLLSEKKVSRRMPLDADPLSVEDIAIFKAWILAKAPEGSKPTETATEIATPARAVRKLPVVFKTTATLSLTLPIGPSSPIAAVAMDPSGSTLATGSYGRVTLWDMKTMTPRKVLTNVLGAVDDLKFSPNGATLAVAGGQPSARGDLRLFDSATGKLLASLGGHLDVVNGVAFSPDGTQIASASFDKTVRLWDVKTAKTLHTYTGHSDSVFAVAFSPKGDWYATASKDRTSRIVDAKTGKSSLTFSGMDQDVIAVAVRADGLQVVTSGGEPPLQWWDAKTGERLKKQAGHSIGVNELAISENGAVVISAGLDGTARTWNAQTGVAIKSIVTPSAVFAVAIDKEGKLVVTGNADGLTRIYDAATGKLLLTLWSGTNDKTEEWFVQAGEGYFAASDGLMKRGSWTATGKPVDAAMVQTVLNKPDLLPKAAKRETLPEPVFGK